MDSEFAPLEAFTPAKFSKRRRVRWTEQEARDALSRWEASGETLTHFARAEGLSLQRLVWWRKRLGLWKEVLVHGSNPRFIRAEVGARQIESGLAVVRLPNGISVELSEKTEASWAASLVNELVGAVG